MKKAFLSILIASGLVLTSQAFALDVGGSAPCVVLDDVQPDNSIINECIRTRDGATTYTLLEFFSVSCDDCAANLPKVSALATQIAATTTTRLVGIDRDAAAIHSYIDSHRDLIDFPVALDIDRDAKQAYDVTATPTVFILDSTNTVVYKNIGVFTDQDIANIKAIVLK